MSNATLSRVTGFSPKLPNFHKISAGVALSAGLVMAALGASSAEAQTQATPAAASTTAPADASFTIGSILQNSLSTSLLTQGPGTSLQGIIASTASPSIMSSLGAVAPSLNAPLVSSYVFDKDILPTFKPTVLPDPNFGLQNVMVPNFMAPTEIQDSTARLHDSLVVRAPTVPEIHIEAETGSINLASSEQLGDDQGEVVPRGPIVGVLNLKGLNREYLLIPSGFGGVDIVVNPGLNAHGNELAPGEKQGPRIKRGHISDTEINLDVQGLVPGDPSAITTIERHLNRSRVETTNTAVQTDTTPRQFLFWKLPPKKVKPQYEVAIYGGENYEILSQYDDNSPIQTAQRAALNPTVKANSDTILAEVTTAVHDTLDPPQAPVKRGGFNPLTFAKNLLGTVTGGAVNVFDRGVLHRTPPSVFVKIKRAGDTTVAWINKRDVIPASALRPSAPVVLAEYPIPNTLEASAAPIKSPEALTSGDLNLDPQFHLGEFEPIAFDVSSDSKLGAGPASGINIHITPGSSSSMSASRDNILGLRNPVLDRIVGTNTSGTPTYALQEATTPDAILRRISEGRTPQIKSTWDMARDTYASLFKTDYELTASTFREPFDLSATGRGPDAFMAQDPNTSQRQLVHAFHRAAQAVTVAYNNKDNIAFRRKAQRELRAARALIQPALAENRRAVRAYVEHQLKTGLLEHAYSRSYAARVRRAIEADLRQPATSDALTADRAERSRADASLRALRAVTGLTPAA